MLSFDFYLTFRLAIDTGLYKKHRLMENQLSLSPWVRAAEITAKANSKNYRENWSRLVLTECEQQKL